jgi:ABC-type Na+ efflux pump permease subunit
MIQPLIFLGLFTPLLAGVTGASTGASLQSFVPGILVMSCLVGTSMTGSNLQMEMKSGSHERLLVSPLGRPAQLVGRALKEIVPVLVQALIIVAVDAAVRVPGGAGRAAGRAGAARGHRGRPRLAVLLAGARGARAGVGVLGRPADAAVPAAAARRRAAAAGIRSRLDARRRLGEPAALPGRRRAGAVRR